MLVLLGYSCYSLSSEFDTSPQYGTTNNAAQFGLNWVMTNVLPQQAGLQVSNVVYRYTTVKNAEDDMLVHVQNENARGPGYIFRSTDDWSGIPGNSINKAVAVPYVDISYWGPGSIEVEGFGTVTNAEVFYTYQFDPCFDPQSNPQCPGYQDPFVIELNEVDVYDPLEDDLVQDELDRKANMKAQEDEEKEMEEDDEDSEKSLKAYEKLSRKINATATSNEINALRKEVATLKRLIKKGDEEDDEEDAEKESDDEEDEEKMSYRKGSRKGEEEDEEEKEYDDEEEKEMSDDEEEKEHSEDHDEEEKEHSEDHDEEEKADDEEEDDEEKYYGKKSAKSATSKSVRDVNVEEGVQKALVRANNTAKSNGQGREVGAALRAFLQKSI